MAANLDQLVHEFKISAVKLLDNCKNEGHELRPFFTLRDPWQQARLWRQSRTREQVLEAHLRLDRKGAPWLAQVLLDAGPAHGPWVTNALPGQSWHNYGEAVDCFVVVNGSAVWDANHPGYIAYARLAKEAGLTAGRYWKGATDPVHVQFRQQSSPLHIMSWPEVDQAMKEMFDDRDN